MKKTRKLVIIVASVAAAIIVGLAVMLSLTVSVKADYTGHINKGNKYMDAGEYDKAVMEFQAAKDMDEDRDEAYEGLYRAYDSLGYSTLSQQILEEGVVRTESDDLRGILAVAYPNSRYLQENAKPEKNADSGPALNVMILSLIAGSTYADYNHQYDVRLASSEGKVYKYEIDELGLELEYTNEGSIKKVNTGDETPYREMMPDSVSVKDLSYLLGTTEPISVDEMEKMEGIKDLESSEGEVTFKAEGCRVIIETEEDELIKPDAENRIISLKETGEEDDDESKGSKRVLKGKVTNATNGEPVTNAKVKVYKGKSAAGKPVEIKTGSNGLYSVETEPGDNFIVVEKEGYITGNFETYVLSKSDITYLDCAISPELKNGEIRIVLTWDAAPRDLDSYLRGTSGSGKPVMTSFTNKKQYDSNGNLIAELDLDDVDGHGPETTTLYDMNGKYEFIVTDFHMTSSMARSNAQVKVYKGSSLVETINITPDAVNMWKVLEIDHGQIKVINQPHSEGTSGVIK